MDVHNNARLTPRGREAMVRAVVDQGLTKAEAARRFNTSAKTVTKWVQRFRTEGASGLHDRSSRPLSSPSQTALATCDAVEALRRQRRTQAAIAAETNLSHTTVSRILRHRGLSLLSALEPAEPRLHYERETPGEIIHLGEDVFRLDVPEAPDVGVDLRQPVCGRKQVVRERADGFVHL